MELHLVTGGAGYVGYNLGVQLAKSGHEVILLDVKKPIWPLPAAFGENMTFSLVDITSSEEATPYFRGVSCVHHLASYGMSGREMLNTKQIQCVNIGGTENVVSACLTHGVPRLVYTSTFNVVFHGQEIIDGDESLPYSCPHQHTEHYSRTKIAAEKLVLEADGNLTEKRGVALHTCALRMAGIYGPGETRHLPRIVGYMERGLYRAVYGSPGTRVQFVHIDNVVQAHVKAAQALTPARGLVAAGEAYFISDGQPINNFEFFRPLAEGLGYKQPSLRLPLSFVYYVALVTEMLHWLVHRVWNFQPLLTRAEVFKTGVTHYFSSDKARAHLGFAPSVVNDLTSTVEQFRRNGRRRTKKRFSFILDLVVGLLIAALLLSFLPAAE